MTEILNRLNLKHTNSIFSVNGNLNNQPNKLYTDNPQGSGDLSSIHHEVLRDREQIDKMFSFANALCDFLMEGQKQEINKWANSRINDHVKKINSSFLL